MPTRMPCDRKSCQIWVVKRSRDEPTGEAGNARGERVFHVEVGQVLVATGAMSMATEKLRSRPTKA